MACCKATGWTPNELSQHTPAQVWPFIAKKGDFKSVGEAQEAIAYHDTQLTRLARLELRAM